MNTLTRKGFGRIYVENEGDIDKVKAIIEKMDALEYDYLPDGLIALYTDYPDVVYTHKFDDLDMDALTAICWARGIHIWVFDAGYTEYPSGGAVDWEESL